MKNAEVLIAAILKLAAKDYKNLAIGKTVAPYKHERQSMTKIKISENKEIEAPSLEELNYFFSSEWCHDLFECIEVDKNKLLEKVNHDIKKEWSK